VKCAGCDHYTHHVWRVTTLPRFSDSRGSCMTQATCGYSRAVPGLIHNTDSGSLVTGRILFISLYRFAVSTNILTPSAYARIRNAVTYWTTYLLTYLLTYIVTSYGVAGCHTRSAVADRHRVPQTSCVDWHKDRRMDLTADLPRFVGTNNRRTPQTDAVYSSALQWQMSALKLR